MTIKWIDRTIEKPSPGTRVLITNGEIITSASFQKNQLFFMDSSAVLEITHWAYFNLPDIPRLMHVYNQERKSYFCEKEPHYLDKRLMYLERIFDFSPEPNLKLCPDCKKQVLFLLDSK